ncbi:MAG: twin-arginine translocase TatA/TatE family subunit [Planctomycetia bacterium]|nr:twin-arginine translocase TatA/TatE family subunit [Planctomycetia bacterium]
MMYPTLAFMGIGVQELLIIGVIAVLLFGTRLPSIARSFGQSVVEFKKGMREIEEDVTSEPKDTNDKTDKSDKA